MLTAGKFGERRRIWPKLLAAISAPYGQILSLEKVKNKLTPNIKVVHLQGTERSTGARHDVQEVA